MRFPVTTIIILMITLTGCTYSIKLIHTEGTATDVVDETSTPSAELNIPIKPL